MFKLLRRAIAWVRKAIVWVLSYLGLQLSPFAGFVTVLVGVLISVIPGMIIAVFLLFLAIRVGPSIFGEFVKNNKFIPVVNAISIIVPAVTVGLLATGVYTVLQKGLLVALGAAAGAIIPVIGGQSKLREFQEETRKDRPSETPAP